MHDEFQYCLKDGKPTHISEINLSEKNCVCPSCGNDFVAYKNVSSPHFKHKAKQSCKYSFETSLHYLAKEIIAEKKYLLVPAYKFVIPDTPISWFPRKEYFEYGRPPIMVRMFHTIHFDEIEVEKWEGNFKPDLKCYVDNKEMYIEITVTHGIDEEKLSKIKAKNVPLLEIRLSEQDRKIDKEELTKVLYGVIQHSYWVHNPKTEKLRLKEAIKANEVFEFLTTNHKKLKLYGKNEEVYNCPRFDPRTLPVKFIDGCADCDFYLGEIKTYEYYEHKNQHPDKYVMCIGHKVKELKSLFRKHGAMSRSEITSLVDKRI